MAKKLSPREARKQAFLKRQEASQRVSAGFHGIFKPNLNIPIWKCDKGSHDIDIIPYIAGKHDPVTDPGKYTYVLEVFVHNNVGLDENKQYICLFKTYGKPCPICEHRLQLINDQDVDEDDEMLKSISISRYPRSIYNILCHDTAKTRNTIQVFNTSHYLFERQLTELAQSSQRQIEDGYPPIISFADPDEGYGISFHREGENLGTRFGGIRFTKRKKPIPDKILEQAYVLDEVIYIPTYDEVYEAYWGRSKEDAEDSENDDQGARRERRSERKSESRGKRREEPEETEDDEDDSYLNKNPESEESEDDSDDGECPNDGIFGEDHDKLDECENCGVWEECLAAYEAMASEDEDEAEESEPEDAPEEEEEEEEEEEKPRTRRTSSTKSRESSKESSGRGGSRGSQRTSAPSSRGGRSGGRSGAGTTKSKSAPSRRRSMR